VRRLLPGRIDPNAILHDELAQLVAEILADYPPFARLEPYRRNELAVRISEAATEWTGVEEIVEDEYEAWSALLDRPRRPAYLDAVIPAWARRRYADEPRDRGRGR
jgi:hypothetical protein